MQFVLLEMFSIQKYGFRRGEREMELDRPRGGKDMKYISLLTKIAEAVPPVRSARLAAALVHKNEIIAFGVNKMKTHPFQKQYGKNPQAIFLHAENDCLLRAMKKVGREGIRGATLYVARVKNPGNVFGNACPCEGCRDAIETHDLGRVVYTTDAGGISVL